jgi:hypothetical protein
VRTGGRLTAVQAWEADLGGRDVRVVRAAEFGGPEVLVPGKAPEPAAGPGQVVEVLIAPVLIAVPEGLGMAEAAALLHDGRPP